MNSTYCLKYKKSVIFSIHKKGEIIKFTSYRGISFIIGKLLTGLLDRLTRWVTSSVFKFIQHTAYIFVRHPVKITLSIKCQIRLGPFYSIHRGFMRPFLSINRLALFVFFKPDIRVL